MDPSWVMRNLRGLTKNRAIKNSKLSLQQPLVVVKAVGGWLIVIFHDFAILVHSFPTKKIWAWENSPFFHRRLRFSKASVPLRMTVGLWELHPPIGSIYGIYGNIYHQYTPNVSIYIIYIYTIHGSYGIGRYSTEESQDPFFDVRTFICSPFIFCWPNGNQRPQKRK